MGSKSKEITVSFWYKLILHLGWCKGPIDALLEIRGGDRTAWSGRQTTSGIVSVNAPELYGGESSEGGIQGDFEVMMGEPDQMPNDYLAANFGAAQSGYRGRSTVVLHGVKVGAGNPYPKPLWFKLERILKGWDNDVCWYPEKAGIPLIEPFVSFLGPGWEYKVEPFSEPNTGWDDFTVPTTGWSMGGEMPFTTNGMSGGEYWTPTRSNIWLRRQMTVRAAGLTLDIAADNGCVVWVDGVNVGSSNATNAPISHNEVNPVSFNLNATGTVEVVVKAFAEIDFSDEGGNTVVLAFTGAPLWGMNPAHMIYDSIVSRRENGGMEEPAGRINEESFAAAADTLYAEGFGLCTSWKGGESAEQFQQRILNVIGGSLTQSRKDGLYYLDLLREGYDVESLPVITDHDILSWSAEPAVPSESINQIQVKWFDPNMREERITTPLQALGAIADAGGVIGDIREYYEIPVESLALRVGNRDLNSTSSALWKFDFSCTRRPYDLRPGTYVRLMCPLRGFADVVAVIGDIDFGNFGGDEIQIIAIQDAFGLPNASYVDPQDSMNPPSGNSIPAANITVEMAMEAPYIEIASVMSPDDLDVMADDTGYLLVGGERPVNGTNYALVTKASGEEYVPHGYGNWCPTMTVVEADVLSGAAPTTTFTFSASSLVDRVEIGSWALWGSEIVRVDALDISALTVEFGRACADTVPVGHEAGSKVFFIGNWNASDLREYLDGETVYAKLLNRNSISQVAEADATEMSVVMDSRASRPYPPGNVQIDAAYYPATVDGVFTVTWAHRNRVAQGDTLVDFEAASVTPAPNLRYALRFLDATAALLVERLDIGPATADVTISYVGDVTMELYAIDAHGVSLQKHSIVFACDGVGATGNTIDATPYTPVDEGTIIDGGDLDA